MAARNGGGVRADRESERSEAFSAMARAFRNLASHSPGALGDAFGWLEFLPLADRRLFADEFARVVTAAAELDNYGPLSQLILEWRATAEVHVDPKPARRLRRPVEAGGDPVPVPVR